MSSRIRNSLSAHPQGRRRRLPRLLRRFARRREGATVVEFAIVIVPFIAIMFAIIETALIFYAGQVLETATADSARLIMTGQAQKQGFTAGQFKTNLCARVHALFNCASGVSVDVRKFGSFAAIAWTMPPYDEEEGKLDTSAFQYQMGVQGDIIVVRAIYEWPTFVRQFGLDLATLPNGKHLLVATAAFRNEPYNN